MIGKIYCISNKINNKLYIGKTTYETVEKRFKEHCKDSQRTYFEKRPLYAAMNKYGIENFEISLIEEVDLSQLEQQEQYWILYYDSYKNGYNATLGGDGKILYDYNLFVEDFNNGLLVKEIAAKYGCDSNTVTNGLRCCGVDSKVNSINRQKHPVEQYNKNNIFIQSFESQRDAARFLISQGHKGSITTIATNIGRVLKGERKTAEGYIWKYKE